ncbi:MAG: dus [Acidimicrobiia bacterium]|nr:dus [Acidimicrobiia bacterium]
MSAPKPLAFGALSVWPPVVLAPMAGVTNAPFRSLCRRYSQGHGLFVSEMIMGRALLEESDRTMRMAGFGPDETPRSIQLYVTDPVLAGAATTKLVEELGVDHVDLNFGCPAPKVTRNGGGSALPVKRNLLRQVVRSVVRAAGSVPVTMKFRIGLDDRLITFLDAGQIGADEGCAAVALHARTTEQLYSGRARWDAVTELKNQLGSFPVLGNGDIWEAEDALAMMQTTGCDGVVIGRGCLGRPWLFGDLLAAFEGRPVPPLPALGEVGAVMVEHAAALEEFFGSSRGVHDFRKHTGWYLTGYPVGSEMRRAFANASTVDELRSLVDRLDPAIVPVPGAGRLARGHTNGPRRVVLPDRYLENLDDATPPGRGADALVSGG